MIKKRCPWLPLGHVVYEKYHDKEWGVPVYDDKKIFEFLVLESAQAGLSWEIVLNKRSGYKKAFADFNVKEVAKFTNRDINRLVKDASIIRNRAKIEAAVNNAVKFLEIQKEFGSFSDYVWRFVDGKPVVHKFEKIEEYPQFTKEAEWFAKDLKVRGFKFLGPTTIYAHMQAAGMVNDHVVGCFRYKEVMKLAK